MLVGVAVGVIVAVAVTLLVDTSVRPDLAIALVLGVPSVFGVALLLVSSRQWVTTCGALCLAIAPGWFGVLVLTQVVHGA